jgi:quinoprotein glucose dehydrogenase
MLMAGSAPRRPYFTGFLFLIVGLVLGIGGIWLAAVGGSLYYLCAGAGVAATGWLMLIRRTAALWLYALVLLGTVLWAIGEVGFNGWGLEPRIVAPTVLGLWLLLPWVRRGLGPNTKRAALAPAGAAALAIVVLIVGFFNPGGISGTATASMMAGQVDNSVADGDWAYYGRTPKGDRFSPLNQITPDNVNKLQVAWTTQTGDRMRPGEDVGGTDAGHEFNFEVTPLKIANTVYVCTGHSWVEALDAATGKIKWKFDPHANTDSDVYLACRGVAYYAAPAGKVTGGLCQTRIISPVLDARVVALDAQTGKPCEDFGTHGFIDLKQYLGHVPAGFHFVTSPPLVLHDRMILGGWVYDNQARGEPSGAVRAFDPISGEIIWAWDVGHPDQVVHPGEKDVLTRGTPNAWGVYTADAERNMVYLPLGNATPDYFGGMRRPFDNAFNSSIVALDITTGQPKWHFQTTHHDVWDMDLPIGPSLVDLPVKGKMVPALIQSSKRGEFWVLNRETGQPIVQTVEKQVPTDGVPGEKLSPTQSYPVGMPSLTPANLVENHLWGATPIDQMMCRIQFRQAHYEGQFTPPQTKNTIVYPAFDGVIDWHGASIDPTAQAADRQRQLHPLHGDDEAARAVSRDRQGAGVGRQGNEPDTHGVAPQYGTPYVGMVHPWLNPLGVPCNPPPWGTLTAIDLDTQKIVWQHPDRRYPRDRPVRHAHQPADEDGHLQHRRQHDHRGRPGLHRRDRRQHVPRDRHEHRQDACGACACRPAATRRRCPIRWAASNMC